MRFVIIAACVLAIAPAAQAQQRPLVTEDPETIGAGNVLIEGGVDSGHDIFYPLSGLHGNLLRLPSLGASFGIGSIAELQVDGGFYQRLNITQREAAPLAAQMTFTGDRTSDVQDLVIGTKIKLLAEAPGRPSIGVRLATRLPLAGNDSGLRTDSMNFYASMLVGKTVQSIRIVGNGGIGVLSDPFYGDHQIDALTYGVSLARAIQQGLELVGEVNGRWIGSAENNPGTQSRGTLLLGGRFTRGTVRVDGGLIVGLTSRDPSIGFTAGLTWVFRGFTIP